MDHKKDNNLHKLFKVIIIMIVLIFIGLIYYFLKLQLSHSSDNYLDYLFEFNKGKYTYFEKEDKAFSYSSNLNSIDECSFSSPIDFYKKYVVQSKPCIVRALTPASEDMLSQFQIISDLNKELTLLTQAYVKSKDYTPHGNITICNNIEGKVKEPSFTKFLNCNSKYYLTGTKDYESKNFLNQFDHLIIVVEGESVFRISPPSQINLLNPYRNISTQKDFWDFNTVYSGNNFFGLDEKDKKANEKVVILSSKVHAKDMIYIPAYFFTQFRITSDSMLALMLDYRGNSRILKTMFKVLFDDNVVGEDDNL